MTHTTETSAERFARVDIPRIYDAAETYATKLGAEHGRNAAEWWEQDAIGGRTTGDPAPTAERVLRGIEDGDPEILDALPAPDLSGQFADTLTGPDLVRDAIADACWTLDIGREQHFPYHDGDEADCPVCAALECAEDFAAVEICDAYSEAFTTAAEDRIAELCRAVLTD